MASTPIKRAYTRRIQEQGGAKMILDEIAAGKTITYIARGLEMSPNFINHYLFAQPGGRAAVHLARLMAVESAVHASLKEDESKLKAAGRSASESMVWLYSRGGFRQAGATESSVNQVQNQPTAPAYVSDYARQYLEALKQVAAEKERPGGGEGEESNCGRCPQF